MIVMTKKQQQKQKRSLISTISISNHSPDSYYDEEQQQQHYGNTNSNNNNRSEEEIEQEIIEQYAASKELPEMTEGIWPPPIYCHFSNDERACSCFSDETSTVKDEDETMKNDSANQYAVASQSSPTSNKNSSSSVTQRCMTHFFAFFSPRGMWAPDQRDHNRRFGALFFLYTAEGAAWAPTAVLVFLLLVSVVSGLSGCAVPLHILGALHAVFALLFIWKQPARVPLDNFLLVVQYAAGAALAFSRGADFTESAAFFMIILVVAVISVAHALFQLGLEECALYPKKLLKFRTMDEEEDRIFKSLPIHCRQGIDDDHESVYYGGGSRSSSTNSKSF